VNSGEALVPVRGRAAAGGARHWPGELWDGKIVPVISEERLEAERAAAANSTAAG